MIVLPIRCVTICRVVDGLIVAHEDMWSLQDVIKSIPLVGRLYGFAKSLIGRTSSMILRYLGATAFVKTNQKNSRSD